MCCKGLTLGLGMYEWTRRSTPPRRAWSSNQSRVLWTDHQILCRFGQISTDSIHREISDRDTRIGDSFLWLQYHLKRIKGKILLCRCVICSTTPPQGWLCFVWCKIITPEC